MLAIVLAVCAVLVLLVPVLAVWADERPGNEVEHTQQDEKPPDTSGDNLLQAA